MKIDDINKVAKRHMVYVWSEKGVFYYILTYTWKSWHLVGFEPTLFGRAKVQPHYAYQRIAKTHMVYILAGKRCIFLYLRLKKLAPGGIWTHHEVTTISHKNTICHTKRHMVYIWPEKGAFSYTYTWKSWHLVGFQPTLFGRAKVQPHYAYQPIAKMHMVYIWPEKGVFSDTYTWKSWHLVGFQPTLFGRAKVQPHYAYQRIAKMHMVYNCPEKDVFSYIYTWQIWHLVVFEPTLFGRAKV